MTSGQTASMTSGQTSARVESMLNPEWKAIDGVMTAVDWDSINTAINKTRRDELCPAYKDIFNAYNNCLPSTVKCVIIGKEPYINRNSADGYAFSTIPSTKAYGTTDSIYSELNLEYGTQMRSFSGSLSRWASEGVLLMNISLTSVKDKREAHTNIGWLTFTECIINHIIYNTPAVIITWGRPGAVMCQQHEEYLKGRLIKCVHPCPINNVNEFQGSNCFINANDELKRQGILPVRWSRLTK